MKKILVVVVALFTAVSSYGQNEIDAFRFSRNDLQGTARAQGMGGAFGALGGDPTGIVINPAGIAVYRSSEISATMGLSNTKITTNKNESQSVTKFDFDNISYVGYFPTGSDIAQSVNFGVTYNRLKNFDRHYTGFNGGRATSLTDFIAYTTEDYDSGSLGGANRFHSGAPWLSVLGWNTYLINPNTSTSYKSLLDIGELVDSEIRTREKGYIDAYDFSVGTNMSDKFYFGLTFSLTDLYYQATSTYWEDFHAGGGFALDSYVETTGSAYQLKLGVIYRPIDQLRLGVSYHSPTWYSLREISQASIIPNDIYYEENGGTHLASREDTPDDAYWNYQLRTPYSWTFSVAAVIGTNAILSLDYEIKDYSAMNLKDEHGYDRKGDNEIIDEDFKIASSVRLGLEYKVTPQLSGRLGYALIGNPYADDFKNAKVQAVASEIVPHYTIEGNVNYFTVGLGYRFTPQFYMDLAFVAKTQTDDLYYFSPLPDWDLASASVSYKNNTYRGLLTLGYKF
jgi:Long-chain fatty acid transport protein